MIHLSNKTLISLLRQYLSGISFISVFIGTISSSVSSTSFSSCLTSSMTSSSAGASASARWGWPGIVTNLTANFVHSRACHYTVSRAQNWQCQFGTQKQIQLLEMCRDCWLEHGVKLRVTNAHAQVSIYWKSTLIKRARDWMSILPGGHESDQYVDKKSMQINHHNQKLRKFPSNIEIYVVSYSIEEFSSIHTSCWQGVGFYKKVC